MSKQIKHLLVVSPSFPKSEENDIVIPPLNLYLRALKIKHPQLIISVVTIHYPFQKDKYQVWDIDVYPCGGANGPLYMRPLIWNKAKTKIAKLHQKQPIDLVQSFWMNEAPLVVQKFCKKNQTPHYCTLMGQDATKSNKYLKLFKNPNFTTICLSEFQKQQLKTSSKINCNNVIPWGITSNEFQLNSIKSREIDVICVSNLIPLKRVPLFIDVIEKIKQLGFLKINSVVIGEGMERHKIQELITLKGLENEISLYGKLPRQEVLILMQKSKFLVHTSSYEAQGYVLNEGLAAGCYVTTLSKGLLINDPKFTLKENVLEIAEHVYNVLVKECQNHLSTIPISMESTISDYENLFNKNGFQF